MNTPPSSNVDAATRIASLFALLVAACAIVIVRSLDFDLAGAYYGWSPTALMSDFWASPEFAARNYPGGEEQLFKSAAYAPLPLLGALGVPKGLAYPVLIGLEVAALAAGAIFAVRRLVTGASFAQAALAALVLIAGSLASGNLARWGQPYYGSVYNYASGAGLAAVALLLTGKVRGGALLMALSFIIHPILGLLFGIFAAAGILADILRYKWRELFVGAAIFAVVAGAWTLHSMRDAGITGAAIPAEGFITFTKMIGYHWYPVAHGLFGQVAYERFEPFLSVCLLIAYYLTNRDQVNGDVLRRTMAGLVALAAVTVVGVVASELSQTPFVIKLALHRASTVILLVGALFVAPGLLRDLTGASWWRAVPAAAILAATFVDPWGPPLVVSVILVIVGSACDLADGRRPHPAVLITFGGVAAGVAWLVAGGFFQTMPAIYLGFDTYVQPLFLGIAAVLLLLRLVGLNFLMPVVIGVAASIWAVSMAQFPDPATRQKAAAYIEAQRWANANTAPDALFMVDPGHSYGWREYSERPSFGNVREWLYAGWLYNSRRDIYEEGLERVTFFGLSIDDILARQTESIRYGWAQLPVDLQTLYYAKDIDWFREASARFGIDYFVMDETKAGDVDGLEVIYRNEGYSIRRLENEGSAT